MAYTFATKTIWPDDSLQAFCRLFVFCNRIAELMNQFRVRILQDVGDQFIFGGFGVV